tara:strand:- start:2199 stop:2588 length:390 start_codon:yes stop_codon:yes gene_type:complete
MSENITILKLMDGSTIVGKVQSSGDIVEIEHPIELVSETRPQAGYLGEQISLRPWVAIAEEHVFTVERFNIINMSTLQENFIAGYNRMVDHIYFQSPAWEGPMAENGEENLDVDTLTELADALLKNKIH